MKRGWVDDKAKGPIRLSNVVGSPRTRRHRTRRPISRSH